MADHVINSSVDKEACPNNLAPTTSTTAQMLMGDALAIALLKSRDFSEQDFSRYHPGGALGKKLYLRCADIAARNEKPAVGPASPVQEVIHSITQSRLGATAVIEDGKVLGIVTDGDIRRMLEKTENLKGIKAADIMNPTPKYMEAGSLAAEAAEIILEKKISQLIILENGNYKGMVHVHDLNREGIL
jgi:arabinose-5-phosphate isomerase